MTATHGVGTYGNAAGTVTPLDHKMAQLGLIVKTAANTIRPGVFWDGNSTLVSGKANMSYDVRALTAVLSRGTTSGAVLLSNDGVFNIATTAAPGSNSRYDVVYLWQREYSIDGTDSNPVIGVIQGTPAASPTVPSLAAFPGAIALAQILVPAGVTATNSGTTITQTGPFTATSGGVVVARTTTERDAYVPASTDLTARCWVITDTITYRWNGSVWKAWESDWITYTPTFTNVTVGNGTLACDYRYVLGRVTTRYSLTFGSTTTLAGSPAMSIPVNSRAVAYAFFGLPGSGVAYDTSAGGTTSLVNLHRFNSIQTGAIPVTILCTPASGVPANISATSPMTWAVGDVLAGEFTYDPA